MTDDEILAAAAGAAREDDVLADPRWPSFAEGSLGEEDRADLVELAQRTEDGRRALDVYRPITAAEQASFVDQILAPAPARAQSIRPRKVRARIAVAFSVVALAAATTLLLVVPGRGLSPVPDYSIALVGEQTQRGPAVAAPVPFFGPGAEVELIARPATRTTGAVAARGFITREGRVEAWSPPIEVSPEGSVRIAGSFEEVFRGVPPGEVDLVLAVGRSGSIPGDPSVLYPALLGESTPREASWRVVRIRVRILARAASQQR